MDLTDEIKFGDFQKQQRYKKLQRELKLARIKQAKIDLWPSSCSSINAEPSDLNCTVTSSTLQTSRTGSEVLASSRHLRNLISKRPLLYKPMATSSVKQYSETDQTVDDRAIMPPPSSFSIIRPPAKRPSPSQAIAPPNQSRQPSFNDEHSSRGKQSFSDVNSSTDHPEDSRCSHDQSRSKPVVRDFYRWRVVLNDQGQLLIKGTLDNGKTARSKPVLKIFSSTKLESIYKHIYCLHGNIVDEKNELPKYIYTKFYSGFPDDWENVHQIWKNYVAQGSRESYRWPTDASFSDDDLNSEITDITHMHKRTEKKFPEASANNKSTPQRSSGYCSDIQQERNSKSSENLNRDLNSKDHSHFSRRNKTLEVLNYSSEKENRSQAGNRNQIENRSQDENRNQGENRSGNLYTALNYAQTLKDYIFEDKLTIITQNLLNENCPREYVKNVNETIEKLNYLISYKITNLDEAEVKRPRIESKNVSPFAEDFERNCSTPLIQHEERVLNASTQVPENEEVKKISNFQREKQILNPQFPTPKTNCDISESETYTGVPKISADRIFQLKPFHSRYKERKFERNIKMNKAKSNVEVCKNYDSSVSFTEDEIQKKYEDKTKSNLNIAQFRGKTDLNPDPLKQNRTPLEVMRKTCFEENRNLIPSNSEKRKTLSDKENIEGTKPGVSKASERKETQSFQNLEINNDLRGKQKQTPVNSEISAFQRSKRPPKDQFLVFESDDNKQEQEEQDEGFKNATFCKRMEKNASGNQENLGNDSFGSEKNPKLLESWTPLVTFDGKDYHLVFEGILLNAVGRPMKKKFISNHVVRRISSRIIETEDHQFYKLVGDLHNTKHVVPKELLSQCRNGCPVKIDVFCATWLKLTGENNIIVEHLQKNAPQLSTNVPSSSRGRRILPPLNFWTDERIVMKDNNAVYKPGDPKDYFVSSGINSPKKPRNPQDQENQTDLTKETGKKSTAKKVDNKSRPNLSNEDPLPSNEARKGSSKSEEVEPPSKNKIALKLSFSSSESEDTQDKINTRLKRKSRKSIDLNESSSKSGKKASHQNQNPRNSNPYSLRKRQKIDHKFDTDIESDSDSSPEKKREKAKLSVKSKPSEVRCTYQRNISAKDAMLSDDQLSVI